MNDDINGFYPCDSVKKILKDLIELNFGYIADEILINIQNGKTIQIQGNDLKKKSESMTIPYTDDKQIQIALKALYFYFVELSNLWKESKHIIKSELENDNYQIKILDSEREEEIETFKPEYYKQKDIFNEMLKKAMEYYQIEDAGENKYER